MAPRTLLLLTCFAFSHAAVNVPLPAVPANASAHGNEKRRRWSGEIRRKIMAAGRRPRIRAAREERRDVVVVVEEPSVNKAREWKVLPEQQETTRQRRRASSAPPVSQRDRTSPRDGAVPPEAVIVRRKRKEGLRVRFDLPEEETSAAPPVEPRFPTGVLGEPPETGCLKHSSAEMTVAFLMSVAAERTAGGMGSAAARIDRGLVARRAKRMEACSRRLSYLRDYCPFEREEEEEVADEECAPETTTAPLPAAVPDHAAEVVRPVKTGLPFKSPESEAEFVKEIRSRYLLKDDSLFRHASKAGVVSS